MMRIGLGASALIIAAMVAISVYGFTQVPPDMELPRQWTFKGEHRAAGRDLVLFGMPLLALAISGLFALLPLIDPRGDNIRRSAALWLTAWIGILALLAMSHGAVVFAAAAGSDFSAPRDLQLFGLCLLLIALGNFLPKSRSNFFAGVRTPWTLSSEHSWSVSNRLAGWLFVLTGLAGAATSLMRDSKTGWSILLAGIAATAVISVVVSYFAWRSDTGGADKR